MKHAPGPWRIDKDNLNVYANGLLAQTYGHTHNGEREANAHLIAAAPELLEALETILKYYGARDNEGLRQLSTAISGARDLVAKARGES